MKKAYAKPHHIDRARDLRLNSTDAEKRLWNRLRDRQLDGHKFRRQHPVCGYTLDFACEELKLAIELDGGQHNDPAHHAAAPPRWRNPAGVYCVSGIMKCWKTPRAC